MSGSGPAWASAGCTAVNGGGFTDSQTSSSTNPGNTITIANFAVGDKVDFTVIKQSSSYFLLEAGNGTDLINNSDANGTYNHSYTVVGPVNDTTLKQSLYAGSGNTISVTATCTPAPAPAVTLINPTSGPPAGGTVVAITGTNFTGATAVKFGGTDAASFTVNSAVSISATSPAGSGTVDVTVTTPAGTSATGAADQFTYVAPGSTDSAKVEAVQTLITPIVAQASGQAMTGAIDTAIGDAFGGGGSGPLTVGPDGFALNFAAGPRPDRFDKAFSALAYGDPGKMPSSPTFEQRWNAWADVRGTGWNGNGAASGVDGRQINVTAGIGGKLMPDLVVGFVGGYEHFDYVAATLGGTLKGDGGSAGGYLGWRFGGGLRFDAAAVWSGLAYNATAGTATGSFNGSRWLLSGGLTGSHRIGTAIFEPSARIFGLWESQTAWTDSLAGAHAAQSFSLGRGSVGAKITWPWMTAREILMSGYMGAYGDYRFGSATAVAGVPAVGAENGLSGRVTAGVSVRKAGGATITLDGELGGFGSSYLTWSARARAGLPF